MSDIVERLRAESLSIAQQTIAAIADAVEQMASDLRKKDKKASIWTGDIAKFVRACEAEGMSKLDLEAAGEITRLRSRVEAMRAVLVSILDGVEADCGEPDCPDCGPWRPARKLVAQA